MAHVFRKQLESERNVNASLYFGNIDPQVTEALLYELFMQFGPVKSLNLPKDRILKSHQGFGFVEYRTIRDAEYSLSILRGVRLFGKTLNLKKAEPSKNELSGLNVNVPIINKLSDAIDVGAKLFISKLSPLVDEQFLSDTFSKFGTLIRPPMIMRDDNGESKGYGFLTFDDFTASDEVIEKMNGKILMNSTVHISYAYKDDVTSGSNKKERHGDKVERLLAESAKSHNVISTNPVKKANKVMKPKGRGRT